MKTLSTLAIALSLAVGAAGFASTADASTTLKKPAAETCVATKTKPCLQKHAAIKPLHKKHNVVASTKAAPVKTAVKKS